MHAIGYAAGRALYGGVPRTMSGGEPSSIKRIAPCDAVGLFVRISNCMNTAGKRSVLLSICHERR